MVTSNRRNNTALPIIKTLPEYLNHWRLLCLQVNLIKKLTNLNNILYKCYYLKIYLFTHLPFDNVKTITKNLHQFNFIQILCMNNINTFKNVINNNKIPKFAPVTKLSCYDHNLVS